MLPGRRVRLGNWETCINDQLDRPEEAATFYRQAAEKYIEIGDVADEGRARNNLAKTLCKLHRHDEARQEILRAIECKAQSGHASEPWTSWSILAEIERDAGKPAAAAEAKRKAMECYLAYRRDGGENHSSVGRLFHAVTKALNAKQKSEAQRLITEYREAWKQYENPEADILQSIVDGSRDRTLADAPELSYSMAAEILFLIETLEKSEGR